MHSIEPSYKKLEHTVLINVDNGVVPDIEGVNYWVNSLCFLEDAMGISFGQSYDNSLTSKNSFGAYYY